LLDEDVSDRCAEEVRGAVVCGASACMAWTCSHRLGLSPWAWAYGCRQLDEDVSDGCAEEIGDAVVSRASEVGSLLTGDMSRIENKLRAAEVKN